MGGTTLTQRLSMPFAVVTDAKYGADPTGTAGSAAAFAAAGNAMSAAGGGVVYVPAGDYLIDTTILFDLLAANVTFRGAGRVATRLFVTSNITLMVSGSPPGQATGQHEFAFEDMTFDAARLINVCVNVGHRDRGWRFARCEFKNANTYGIYSGGMQYLDVDDCDFHNENGLPTSVGVGLDQGGRGARVSNSRFDWLTAPITFPTSNMPYYNPQFENNYVNGHWWQFPTAISNSGGTVTYTGTSVVDSSSPFNALVAGYVARSRTARVLVTHETGSTTVTYRNRIVDAAADFSGVQPGWIVRLSDRWAVVDRVATITTPNDTVFVGQWYELGANWGKRTIGPSTSVAYTIFEVYHAPVVSISNTTLTIDTAWSKLATGAAVTPSAGTLYELLVPHQSSKGIHIPPGVHDASAVDNTVEATYLEGVFNFGSGTRIVGNVVRFGQDHGITSDTGTMPASGVAIVGNVVQAQGGNGISVYGDDSLVDANVVEGCNLSQRIPLGCAIQVSGGGRCNITGNRMTNTPTSGWELGSAIADYAIRLVAGAHDCLVEGNVGSDFPTALVYSESDAGTGNEIRNNKGGAVVHHASAPASLVEHSGAGTPEAAVKGSIGSTFTRTDGGAGTTLYVKESGTGTTGWEAHVPTSDQRLNGSRSFEPEDHGYQGWTYDPALLPASQAVLTAGVLYLMRIKVPRSITATGLAVFVSTLGVTLANTFTALFTSGGVLIGVSADRSTEFQSTGLKNGAGGNFLSGPFAVAGGPGAWVYGALLIGSAGTMAQFQRALTNSAAGMSNSNQAAALFRAAQNGTGLSAVPGSITPGSNVASSLQLAWMGIT